ncbi:MAG: rhamnogalacturonan acetylesterase [Treponemataceae bacterium]|nr:rhamnogalacturonan acetylesterase [Treponemataceae bacterium]
MNIFIAGDSTFQYNNSATYPMTGIGQMLPLYFTNLSQPDLSVHDIDNYTDDLFPGEPGPEGKNPIETVTFYNYARNGRSTRNFISEGRLSVIDKQIKAGDFLFIIFGHNDQKADDPKRFTDPDTDFKANLLIFAQTAEKHGAFPVFFTPVARRIFDEKTKTAKDTLKPYGDAMKDFAKEKGYPLVDLSELSRKLITETGYEKAGKFYMGLKAGVYANYPEGRVDDTHLTPDGAYTFAGLCAQGLQEVCVSWEGKNQENYEKLASFIRLPAKLGK